ncbi:hypothetical protein BD626DRAFT_631781 [Schizophyllum amplum]|uniref:Uncharacterized protein n=1 Tax=Schizophyllum amplum TaxID=97359 RepID=A0A550C8V7_9AGAR|nr:hypothetical protein BD626DRAFT_631781 [Auriculariopsis ampla]
MSPNADKFKDAMQTALRSVFALPRNRPVSDVGTCIMVPLGIVHLVGLALLRWQLKKETRLLDELDVLLTAHIDMLSPEALAKLQQELLDMETQRNQLTKDAKSFLGASLWSAFHAHKVTKLCKGLLNEGRAAVNEATGDAIANFLVLELAPRGSRTDAESIGTDGLSTHNKVQHRDLIFFGGNDASRSALLKAVRDASLSVALENAVAPGVLRSVRDNEVIDMIYKVVPSETQADSSNDSEAPALLIYLPSYRSTLHSGGGVASSSASLGNSAVDSPIFFIFLNPEEAPVFRVHFVNDIDLQAGVAGDLSFITDMTKATVASFKVKDGVIVEFIGDAAFTAQQVSEMINSVSLEQVDEGGVDEISRFLQGMMADEAAGSDKDRVATGDHVQA